MAAHAWWRILITANNGDPYCTLRRIEMHAVAGSPDLCRDGSALASSTFSSDWGPQSCFGEAVDGNGWSSASDAGFPHWIGYHFNEAVSVSEVQLSFASTASGGVRVAQSPRNLSVQWSDDGAAWTTAGAFTALNAMVFGEIRRYSIHPPLPHVPTGMARNALARVAGPPTRRVLYNLVHQSRLPIEGVSPGRHSERPTSRMRDFWGYGRVEGTVRIEGVPAARKVRLFDALTGLLIDEIWSGRDGHYRFDFLDPARDYFVLAHDHVRQFNAVIADWVQPEPTAYS